MIILNGEEESSVYLQTNEPKGEMLGFFNMDL